MIANTFIKRPVTAIVISLVLMISGSYAFSTLLLTSILIFRRPVYRLTATIPAPMHKPLSKQSPSPIEEQVNGTPGMEYMQSTSTNTGGMNIRVTFNIGTNVQLPR